MTAAELRIRVEKIRASKPDSARTLAEWSLFVDVLRVVANSNVARAGVRAIAEEALRVTE